MRKDDAAAQRPRARDLGLKLGRYEPGPENAITDVEGVRVGHSTIIEGEGELVAGEGPIRTGVTAILPNAGNIFHDRVLGGAFVLNGAGEVSGLTQLQEWGLLETPVFLTNTHSVGAVSEACVRWLVDRYPGIGDHYDVVIPLVGECDDSWLNDIAGGHVRYAHVVEAIESARGGRVEEGSVGGGTGMVCCDLKGGIGTSSRVLTDADGAYTLGVLVMTNFGRLEDLSFGGVPIGPLLAPKFATYDKRRSIYGSIITVVATDAPLLPHQLSRLARRAALGIGRVGSYAAHGSGEIVVAFSTANTVPREMEGNRREVQMRFLVDTALDCLYAACVEATEESILNALCAAEPMTGQAGHHAPALPVDDVREILERHRRALYG